MSTKRNSWDSVTGLWLQIDKCHSLRHALGFSLNLSLQRRHNRKRYVTRCSVWRAAALSVAGGEISAENTSLSILNRTQDILGRSTSCLSVIGINSYKWGSVRADILRPQTLYNVDLNGFADRSLAQISKIKNQVNGVSNSKILPFLTFQNCTSVGLNPYIFLPR